MKFVKTDTYLYISIGHDIETIQKNDSRFEPVLKLLEADAPDSDVIWCLYGDVVNKAKNLLSHLGERNPQNT